VIKHNFDQTPILLETFDQVIRSSEIRSSDPLSADLMLVRLNKIHLDPKKKIFLRSATSSIVFGYAHLTGLKIF
jgi:hypothetical protein